MPVSQKFIAREIQRAEKPSKRRDRRFRYLCAARFWNIETDDAKIRLTPEIQALITH